MFASKFLTIFFLVSVFNFNLFSQVTNKYDEPVSDEFYKILEEKKLLIVQEITTDKNEWSGIYSLGDHHPTIFMWSANQGFLTWGSHHTFFPSRMNFGKLKFSDNRLEIQPEINKEHLNYQSIPAEFMAVKWGEQHFLIPSDELINFAYAVHSEAESQIVNYFAKNADYQKKREGLPNLPKEYEKILMMKAIKPKIIAVKSDKDLYKSEITLNLGRAANLIKGMIFYYVISSGSLSIMITEIQEKTSKAVIVGISKRGESEIKPRIGLKFTSKAPNDFYDH